MVEKTRLNIVEAVTDEEQAFDQPCKHENRVGFHGTYCHNLAVGARKCPYRFTSSSWHSECEGYEANPMYIGGWEGVQKPLDV
jgi:hypothetical protein